MNQNVQYNIMYTFLSVCKLNTILTDWRKISYFCTENIKRTSEGVKLLSRRNVRIINKLKYWMNDNYFEIITLWLF